MQLSKHYWRCVEDQYDCVTPAHLKHKSKNSTIPKRQKFWAASISAALLPISAWFICAGKPQWIRSRISGQLRQGQMGGGGRSSSGSSSSLLAFPWRLLLWWKRPCWEEEPKRQRKSEIKRRAGRAKSVTSCFLALPPEKSPSVSIFCCTEGHEVISVLEMR